MGSRRSPSATATLAISAAFALSLTLGGCDKKEPSTDRTELGDPATKLPTLPGGESSPEYAAVKACCDALMAGVTDPESGDRMRRAGMACAAKAAEVAAGHATKADVMAMVQPIVTDKLPEACR